MANATDRIERGPHEASAKLASGFGQTAGPSLIGRLRNRAYLLRCELERIEDTINVLDKNQQLVELVEAVLLAQGKAEGHGPLAPGY